jgi:NAD(P)-dependent dehydrogenase (short-subunit alcohol dehydrogenase family)
VRHGFTSSIQALDLTDSNISIGKQLAQNLYSRDAAVYIAAPFEEKAKRAIESSIHEAYPLSQGRLIFLRLDLGDLTTIKASANESRSKETKLHVLFNNAVVMIPLQGPKTAQNYELQLGTNKLKAPRSLANYCCRYQCSE